LARVEAQLIMQNLNVKDLLHFANCSRFLRQSACDAFAWKYTPIHSITNESMSKMDKEIRKIGHLIHSDSPSPIQYISLGIRYEGETVHYILSVFCEAVIEFCSNLIKSADFGECFFDCSYSQKLITSMLHELPFLTELVLSNTNLDESDVSTLAGVLKNNQTITLVNLEENNFYDSGVSLLASYFQTCPNLTSINLSMTGMSYCSESMASVVEKMVHVYLDGNTISDTSLEVLSRSIKNSSSLQTLGLRWNDFDDDGNGISIIADAIQQSKSLTSIDLSYNNEAIKHKSSITSLANAIKNNSTLTSLDLSDCDIGDENIGILCNAIILNPIMKNLFLSNCGIGNDGVQKLGNIFHSNNNGNNGSSITSLDLENNDFGSKGVVELLKAISQNKNQLTYLNLAENIIGDEGATAIAQVISCNSNNNIHLDTLHVNLLSQSGLQSIFHALLTNTCLVNLNLYGNNIELDSIKILCNVIQQNQVLSWIKLQGCRIYTEGIKLICDSVLKRKQNKKIFIDMSMNYLQNRRDVEAVLTTINKTMYCEVVV